MVYWQDDPLRLVGPVRNQIQQLDGSDLVTLAAVSSLLLAIAFVASYIPALRAQ